MGYLLQTILPFEDNLTFIENAVRGEPLARVLSGWEFGIRNVEFGIRWRRCALLEDYTSKKAAASMPYANCNITVNFNGGGVADLVWAGRRGNAQFTIHNSQFNSAGCWIASSLRTSQ